MLRYKTEARPGLVALYDIRPGNGAGQFLQPRSPHGAIADRGRMTSSYDDVDNMVTFKQMSVCYVAATEFYMSILYLNTAKCQHYLFSILTQLLILQQHAVHEWMEEN